jgi:hypothetical protein
VTGRRSAIRYEISESWRMSFSVSFATDEQDTAADEPGSSFFRESAVFADFRARSWQ